MKPLKKILSSLLLAALTVPAFAQYEEGAKYLEAKDYDNAIRCFKVAAEQGNIDAVSELCDIYKDEKQDYVQAINWLRKYAVMLNDVFAKKAEKSEGDSLSLWACYNDMADIYEEGGHGVERDLMQAAANYEKACKIDNSSAGSLFSIAKKFYMGDSEEGVAQDYGKAAALFQKAYNFGFSVAAYELAECYFRGLGVEKDQKRAFELYEACAKENHIRAMNMLGVCYYDGLGTTANYDAAKQWLTKAAEANHAMAQYNLAVLYREKLNNAEMAFFWQKKAAENGVADAQQKLGFYYEQGIGTEVNIEEALKWYRAAAEQGNAAAQNNLGMMFYNGKGVAQDYAQAASLFQKAAEKGDDSAQLNLGFVYKKGLGVEKDIFKAIVWLQASADQNNADACWILGNIYYNGEGVKKDILKGYKLRNKAADLGHPTAKKEREFFENARKNNPRR